MKKFLIPAFAFLACTWISGASAQPAPKTVITTYNVAGTSIHWFTCGAALQGFGCYGNGSLPAFGHACAALQSIPITSGNTFYQKLYVLDSADPMTGGVVLHIFEKKDVIGTTIIDTTFTQGRPVTTPLHGGTGVTCFAAANTAVVVVGTNTSAQAVSISKKNGSVQLVGGIAGLATVSAIDPGENGMIAVNVIGPAQGGSNPDRAFFLLDANGAPSEEGGGNSILFSPYSTSIH